MKKNDIINEALRMIEEGKVTVPDFLDEIDSYRWIPGAYYQKRMRPRKKVESRIVEPKQLGDGK